MARTALVVVQAALAGIALGAVAADVANGNTIANSDGKVYIHLRNTNAGSTARTLTIAVKQATRPADGQFPAMTVAAVVVSVAAGAEKIIGPIPPAYVSSDGVMDVDGSHAELLVSPFRLG